MKKLFLFILCTQITFQLCAVSAYPYPIVFTQPNGDTLTLTMKGDEFANYAVSSDGYTLLYNENGYFAYAQLDSYGDLIPSPYIAKSPKRRNRDERLFLGTLPTGLHYSESQQANIQSIRNIANHLRSNAKSFPTTGNRKLICILMETPDRPFTKTAQDFQNLFNQIGYNMGGAAGSVKDFFLECSYNQLNLSVDICGPYTASHNMAYYAGSGGDSRNLLAEGLAAANSSVDFSQYDNDHDGTVDGVYMIFSGHGEEAGGGSDCIWSHAWSIGNTAYDGVNISSFACSPECKGSSGSAITNIGVICHEFGHTLGAPDYYDTNYESNGSFEGTGSWDLQANGSWNGNGRTPAHPNPRSKVYTYQWATATTISSPQQIALPPSKKYKNAFYRINTNTPNEYYIIENRQQEGFDITIPSHGMLIYHASASLGSGTINASHPQKFYIVSANSNQAIPSGEGTYGSLESTSCPWPGSLNKTEFSDTVIPSMKAWNGSNTEKSVTEITEIDDMIFFNFMNAESNNTFNIFIPNIVGINFTPTNGSVSPVNAGESFSFTYQLEDYYDLATPTILVNGDTLTANNNIYTISNITEHKVVTIRGLTINKYPITAITNGQYNISPADTSWVAEGQTLTYRILPSVGYEIDEVFVDNVSVGYLYDYTFSNVNTAHTLYATTEAGSSNNMTITPTTLAFSANLGDTSEVQSVWVAENNNGLSINILTRCQSNYQISLDQETWKQSLIIYRENLPQELYIRFCPKTTESSIDSISFASIASLNFLTLYGNVPTAIELYANDDISIYPNPTQGLLKVIRKTADKENATICIYDVYGKKLQEFSPCTINMEIDMTHFPSGIYFLKINTATESTTHKIIKQK